MSAGAEEDDEYEEVEWEDAVADDGSNAVVDEVVAGSTGQGITIELDTGVKRRVTRIKISKEYRALCQGLHRVHLLCLLTHARLHDAEACRTELQARMLSLLPLRLLPSASTTFTIPALKQLLDWFKSCFSLMAHFDDTCSLSVLADRALELKAGPAELLVLLFVALLRSQGALVRFVALLDALPLEPWRRAAHKPLHVLSVREAKAKEAAHQRKRALEQMDRDEGEGKKGQRKRASDGLDDEVEEAVRGLLNGADARAYSFKGLMSDLAEQLPDIKFTKAMQKSIKALADDMLASDNEGPQAGSKRGRPKRGNAESSKRSRGGGGATAVEAAAPGPGGMPGSDGRNSGGAKQPPSGAAADEGAAGPRLNRGDEEFDRELSIALMATAAEAEARERHKLAGAEHEAGPSNPDKGRKLHGLRAHLFGRAAGSKSSARGRGTAESCAGQGQVTGSRDGLVPTVWAEVYVGCAETGRWVHVDVVNSLVDKPETVEAATQRSSPAAYIIACSPGAQEDVGAGGGGGSGSHAPRGTGSGSREAPPAQEIKDVTNRYISSLLSLQRVRDGQWWDATLAHMFGPAAASGQLPAGPYSGPPRPDRPAQAVHPGAALPEVLRARREDAELEQRASSQLHGLPSSIDGFKAHPVYVLKRHITKYEALRPGTVLLGTHRGEPFYARAALSALHTADRWRREGKEVRAEELEQPAKMVVKRKQPPLPGTGPGKYGAWGRGQGAGRKARGKANADDALGDDGDLGEEAPAADAADAPSVALYGAWQTEPWRRPRALNGVVPKNKHGNVDVPPLLPELPIGTVHLQYPAGIGGVCRSLNIDFAPALVGFEVQGGRMLPKLDGIVVCEEFESQVVAAYLERETAKQEVLAARRRREAAAAWAQLLSAMRTRLQLRSSYESAAGPSSRPVPAGSSVDVVDLTEAADSHVPSQQQLALHQLRDKYQHKAATAVEKPELSGMEVEQI